MAPTPRTSPQALQTLARLLDRLPPRVRARTLCEVDAGAAGVQRWPVVAVTLGADDPQAPAFGVFGGVHGLERIGCEVALAFLGQMLSRLDWDDSLVHLLKRVRVVVMPIVNPGGLVRGTRANPQGVDLMRNAPVDCEAGAPWLVGGQRIGPHLPWYRGEAGAPMQPEAQAMCEVVEQDLLGRPFALAVDCHSGFGLHDRLWFPHAHTPQPVAHLPELHAFGRLLDSALPHHRYRLEPQSQQYLTHGDLWDHLYLRAVERHGDGAVFLPLTLEMGSWLWVKKNPRQVFSRHGIFNPLIEHRQQRVLRRHLGLLDVALRATASHARWQPIDAAQREAARTQALAQWYGASAA